MAFGHLVKVGKTNPIQTQFKAKTNPISEMANMNVNSCFTMNYEQRTMNYELKTKPTYPGVVNAEAASNQKNPPAAATITPVSLKVRWL